MSLSFTLIAFGIVATFFWFVQFFFSLLENWKQKNNYFTLDYTPKISVVIPVYNEPQFAVNKTLESVLSQKKVQLDIIVIDDGSSVPTKLEYKDVHLFRLSSNMGKRHAQMLGVNLAKNEWIATVDSDTILDENAIYELYVSAVQNNFDAVTGSVFLLNEKKNLLTKMTACMYWFSFYQERASQSYFGAVNCCSGALSLYRKDTIVQNQDDYLNQLFFGQKCDTGDDRHLTNIFLLNNKKVGWSSKSVAYTFSPFQFKPFVKQQLRWIRSQIVSLYYVSFKINKYNLSFFLFTFKLLYQHAYMLILYISMVCVMIREKTFVHLLIALATILVVTLIKILIALLYTKQIKFMNLLVFSMFSFFVFNPLMLYGIFTPFEKGWNTRKSNIIKEMGK